jgi:hypothetical protein
MLRSFLFLVAGLTLFAPWGATARAVTNPDISVIGQPSARWTDDAGDPAAKRATLDAGETEIVFDAALNPYARGAFTLAFAEEGLELEEGYFTLSRGLPGGLALKGGKYRAGFGRLNPVHGHAYPFAERFGVLAEYLPGEESLNEVGVQLSQLLPLGSDAALTVALDWLQGDTFRIERASSAAPNDPLELDPEAGDRADEPRPAALGRVSAFFPLGAQSALDIGVSATRGTNNIAAVTRTTVVGADVKAKFGTGPVSALVVQGEWLSLSREDAAWDEPSAAYVSSTVDAGGGYVFADYRFDRRYNAGVSYERFRRATAEETTDQAFGVFAGLSLLEETTAFRVGLDRVQPGRPPGAAEDPEAILALTLRVVFSMGPHKPHVF